MHTHMNVHALVTCYMCMHMHMCMCMLCMPHDMCMCMQMCTHMCMQTVAKVHQ